jgi:hypothetical protein
MVGVRPMGVELPVEFRLAAACATWPHSEHRVAAVSRAAREAVDWNRFLRVVARHGVVGLAHDGLRRAGIDVPAEPLCTLDAQARALARRNLHMAREAVRVRGALAAAAIPVVFLKGLPLAMLAYGTIAFRDMIDIDILVAEDQVPAATELLRRMGYRQRYPAADIGAHNIAAYMRVRKHFDFVHYERRIVVELHWRLVDNPLLHDRIPEARSWIDVAMAPAMTLPTLAPDDLAIYLVLHGAQHGWSRMKWIADVAALCAREPARAGRLMENAAGLGVSRPALQALLLAACLFGAPMPDAAVAVAADERMARRLATTALRLMARGHGEIGPDDTLFGSVAVSLPRFLLRPGWRFKWSVLKIALTTAQDLALVPVSERWRFLYPVMRLPLWLWRRIHGSTSARTRPTGSD